MTYLSIILGLSFIFLHSFIILSFTLKITSSYKAKRFTLFLFPPLNAFVFGIAYFNEVMFPFLYMLFYLILFIELVIVLRGNLRASWFGASSFLINITSIHLLVLIIANIATGQSLYQIYLNTTFFFFLTALTYFILFIFMIVLSKFTSIKQINSLSFSKFYSELMSALSTILFFFIAMDTWSSMDHQIQFEFLLAALVSCVFALVLYYCFFIFNVRLSYLHQYKRKADEIKTLHNEVIEKKVAAELMVYSDDLTKLHNRRYIYAKIDELIESGSSNFGLIYSDLASLKLVNDTYGHKVGDEYILKIADIFRNSTRDHDVSARIGGDEFLILLYDLTSQDLEMIVNRIKNKIIVQSKKEKYVFYANLGYALFETSSLAKSRVDMIKLVDDLMKKEKELFYFKGGKT